MCGRRAVLRWIEEADARKFCELALAEGRTAQADGPNAARGRFPGLDVALPRIFSQAGQDGNRAAAASFPRCSGKCLSAKSP